MWVSPTHCLLFFSVPGRKLLREACARRMQEMDQRGRDFLAENSCVASTLACREQEQQAQNRSTCHRHFSEIDLVYANVEYCGATFGTSTTSGLKLLPRVSFQGSKNVNARLPRDYQLSARPVHLHNCIRRSRASAKGKGDVV